MPPQKITQPTRVFVTDWSIDHHFFSLEDDFAMVLLEDANEKIYLTEEKPSGPVRGSKNWSRRRRILWVIPWWNPIKSASTK